MQAFLPKDKINEKKHKPFVIYINDRRILTNFLINEVKIKKEKINGIVRILDKKDKIKKTEFIAKLKQENLNTKQIETISSFMEQKKLPSSDVAKDLEKVLEVLKKEGYEKWIEFKPSLVRGFDYYNGIVYEVYDNDPKNNRSLFGGGRYDGLGKLFGNYDIPAVGVAPGDETLKLFLENWKLLDNVRKDKQTTYYIPLIEEKARGSILKLSKKLKTQRNIVIEGLQKQSLSKSLEFANKKNVDKVIIIGTQELNKGQYLEKDMRSGKQNVIIM